MRGRNGGVRLARPAAAIRIGDVVRATEVTHVEIEDGTVGRKQKRGRGVNKILDDALGAFIDVLDQHTLADMADEPAYAEPASAAAQDRQRAARPRQWPRPRYRRSLQRQRLTGSPVRSAV